MYTGDFIFGTVKSKRLTWVWYEGRMGETRKSTQNFCGEGRIALK
jgi:hypothetical protein